MRYAWLVCLHLCLLCGCLTGACSDLAESAGEPLPAEPVDSAKLVPVQLTLSGFYDAADLPDTRADATTLNNQLTDDLKRNFADSATLWILIEEQVTNSDGSTSWVAKDITTPYAIQTRSDGSTSDLIPCTVDDDGKVKNLSSKMLYLTEGTFRLRALSPAAKLTTQESGGVTYSNVMTLVNGRGILASYSEVTKTAPVVVTIEAQQTDMAVNDRGIKQVELNPLLYLSARLKFIIEPATSAMNYIYSISPMNVGCEISGLQTSENLLWTAVDTKIQIFYNGKNDMLQIPADDFTVTGTTCSFSTDILPTSTETSPIFLTFNLRVNNVPTQFMANISGQVFDYGYTYTYYVRVSMDNDVKIASWNSSASTTTVNTETNETKAVVSPPIVTNTETTGL